MWTIEPERIDEGTHRWRGVASRGSPLSFDQVGEAWRSDAGFRESWVAHLEKLPFDAYCWECPPVHERNGNRPFECVFVASPSLARMAVDPDAFAAHFRQDCDVVTFGNLGGDAVLVAPCPGGAGADFAHIARFTATAPRAVQHSFWQAVGEALEATIGPRPVWLSTAGHGVGWLHVRLDSWPKYYRHEPYRRD